MGVKNGYTFDQVYENYLAWFHENAVSSAQPKDKEAILGYQMGHEDVFEREGLLLNRMYYFIPLFPSESKSKQLEIFVISELNLLEETSSPRGNDFDKMLAVEYSGHAFNR